MLEGVIEVLVILPRAVVVCRSEGGHGCEVCWVGRDGIGDGGAEGEAVDDLAVGHLLCDEGGGVVDGAAASGRGACGIGRASEHGCVIRRGIEAGNVEDLLAVGGYAGFNAARRDVGEDALEFGVFLEAAEGSFETARGGVIAGVHKQR